MHGDAPGIGAAARGQPAWLSAGPAPGLPTPAQQARRTPGAGTFRTILGTLQRPGAGQRLEVDASSAAPGATVPAPWEVPGSSGTPKGLAGLRWAAEQLEAGLWAQLLQEALKPGQGGLFGRGFSGQVYGDWFSEAMATLLVKSGAGQLARLLVEEFSSALTGDHTPEGNRGGARGVTRPIQA